MNNVKVKAGQVWECIKDSLWVTNYGDKAKVSKVGNNTVCYNSSTMSAKAFDRCFKFIPQNDLEWLAVNESEWDGDGAYPFIVIIGWVANYTSDHTGRYSKGHTREQWQNMRYSLGLDTKPHYKLIGGQWTKAA